MGEEGGDRVELGLGLEPVSRNVNLILSPVDELCCHHLLFSSVLGKIVHEAQADVALQGVAVGAAGGLAHILPIPVNGLSPPRPEVQVCVVVVQDEHGEAFVHPIMLLLQQGISAKEVHPLEGEATLRLGYTLALGPGAAGRKGPCDTAVQCNSPTTTLLQALWRVFSTM